MKDWAKICRLSDYKRDQFLASLMRSEGIPDVKEQNGGMFAYSTNTNALSSHAVLLVTHVFSYPAAVCGRMQARENERAEPKVCCQLLRAKHAASRS